jgi:hypothetical protein
MKRLVLFAAALLVCACQSEPQAPTDLGVCYHFAAMQGGKPKFNVVASNVPDMEHCAAVLEGMRIKFLSLGGTNQEITGAYQGNFIFLETDGIFTATSFNGGRYPFLVRSGGRLVPVGSAPQ